MVLVSKAVHPNLLFEPGPSRHLLKQLKHIRNQQTQWVSRVPLGSRLAAWSDAAALRVSSCSL